MAPTHPRMRALVWYLDESRTALLDAVAAVPEAFRDVRPAPDAWSVGEILEHLAMVEGSMVPFFAEKLEWGIANGIGTDEESETESIMHGLDVFRLPTPEVPLKAPDRVTPPSGVTAAGALGRLAMSRAELLGVLARADGYDLTKVHGTHMIMGRLNLYQWVLFVAQHEARHAIQIRTTAHRLADAHRMDRAS